MKQGLLYRQVSSLTLCILYLSLSLFSISCAYHCAFKDVPPSSHQHADVHQSPGHTSHNHQHNSSDNKNNDSDHDKIVFCKFIHNVGNPVIAVSHIVIAGLGVSFHEAPYTIAFVYQRIYAIQLSRGPPSALS